MSGRFGCNCEISGKPLKKQLVGKPVRRRTIPCYLGFDSPARVCFLSVPRPYGTSNARTFQVEQQMVAGHNSTGRLLGYRGLDNYLTAGIRLGRPRYVSA